MFQSARIKLTVWYLVIIMAVSSFFSLAFYNSATQEIQRIINRSRFEQLERELGVPAVRLNRPPGAPSIEELMDFKGRIILALLSVNSVIFVFAGLSGYFLAGRTLLPIKQMVEEQEHFISDASHELRTPISTLRAEMEGALLEKHISETQARHLIKSNLEELNSLQLLSDSLLKLTRVHSPKNHPSNKTLLSEILDQAVAKVSKIAADKHITINTLKTESTVSVDPVQLTELFVILLDNAIKYSPEKTHINIDSHKETNYLVINVTDHGNGISSEDIHHVFERFYRADKSRSKVEGYGLGLAIAQNIVTSMKGIITVTSQLNSGSTFTVKIPSA